MEYTNIHITVLCQVNILQKILKEIWLTLILKNLFPISQSSLNNTDLRKFWSINCHKDKSQGYISPRMRHTKRALGHQKHLEAPWDCEYTSGYI